MKTDTILRIYKAVKVKPKTETKYAPVRKHYNVGTFG
tara:strand:- start:285 stop:395 length:111 start_codon:yes stop_codon:yes gene_type:complete